MEGSVACIPQSAWISIHIYLNIHVYVYLYTCMYNCIHTFFTGKVYMEGRVACTPQSEQRPALHYMPHPHNSLNLNRILLYLLQAKYSWRQAWHTSQTAQISTQISSLHTIPPFHSPYPVTPIHLTHILIYSYILTHIFSLIYSNSYILCRQSVYRGKRGLHSPICMDPQ